MLNNRINCFNEIDWEKFKIKKKTATFSKGSFLIAFHIDGVIFYCKTETVCAPSSVSNARSTDFSISKTKMFWQILNS
jgi:hypothetical protein